MLQFIVLGQVPGTNIQIGFTGVIVIVASILASYALAQIVLRTVRKTKKTPILQLDDVAL